METENRILNFLFCSDLEYYEKYLSNLPLEQQAAFLNEFPDFLETEMIQGTLDEDEVYRSITKG
jgi:hypothetical protein